MITERQKEWAERVFLLYTPTELKDTLGDALLVACLNTLTSLQSLDLTPADSDIAPLQNLKALYDCTSELVATYEHVEQGK